VIATADTAGGARVRRITDLAARYPRTCKKHPDAEARRFVSRSGRTGHRPHRVVVCVNCAAVLLAHGHTLEPV
jgi:hypothetical protein